MCKIKSTAIQLKFFSRNLESKNGFTLVELSIVLVIVGLLIGGILVAQSMIGAAKIQKTVRQVQQYDVAVANFQTRYKELPGDTDMFDVAGDNNGFIDQYGGGNTYEYDYAWVHLSEGVGLKNSSGTDYQAWDPLSDSVTELNCPRLLLTQNLTDPPCLIMFSPDLGYGERNYFYYLEAGGGVFSNGISDDILTPSDALAIDLKIDDGLPSTGKVISDTEGPSNTDPVTQACNVSGAYNTSYSGYYCTIYFEFGGTNGIEY